MHYGPKVVQGNMDFCIDIGNVKSGSNATDFVAGNTVTLNNTPTYSSDGYMSFDGVNEDITISISSGNFDYPTAWTDNFSLEVWVYFPNDVDWSNAYRSSILTRGGYAGSHGLWRHPTDNTISAWARSGTTSRERTVGITRDAWYHIVMTWENDTLIAIYKNGALGQSMDPGDHTAVGSANIDTGAWKLCSKQAASGAQGQYYEGRMAMARMYKKALTAAEVLQNFNATRGRFGV